MTPTLDGARAADAGLGQRLRLAAHWIKAGGVVAYPTEAVYGLGCDPWNGEATRRILTLKQRPESKGLIVIAADFQQLTPFVEPLEVDRMAAILAAGPLAGLLWAGLAMRPGRPSQTAWTRPQAFVESAQALTSTSTRSAGKL